MFDNYSSRRGWEETNKNWYTCVLTSSSNDIERFHADVIFWLRDNINNYVKHCVWKRNINGISIRFRFDKDYNWFVLKWK